MFLLNETGNNFEVLNDKFTIQNVPIKHAIQFKKLEKIKYLQYKMFLLNIATCYIVVKVDFIYNTKCSY